MNVLEKLSVSFAEAGDYVNDLMSLNTKCLKTLDGHVTGIKAGKVEVDQAVSSLKVVLDKLADTSKHRDISLQDNAGRQKDELEACRKSVKGAADSIQDDTQKLTAALQKLADLARASDGDLERELGKLRESFSRVTQSAEKTNGQVANLQKAAMESLGQDGEQIGKFQVEMATGAEHISAASTQVNQQCEEMGRSMELHLKDMADYGKSEVGALMKSGIENWTQKSDHEAKIFVGSLTKTRDTVLGDLSSSAAELDTWLEAQSAEIIKVMDAEVNPSVKRARESSTRASANARMASDVCVKMEPLLPAIEALYEELTKILGKGK